jgi:hypothetical protein
MHPPRIYIRGRDCVDVGALAWNQLRQLALDEETSTQALGEEAVNLLFAKHGINRSA